MKPSSLFRALIGAIALLATSFSVAQDVPAKITDAIKKADAGIAKIVAVPEGQRTFENTLVALDDVTTQLDTDTALFVFQQYVSTDANERDAARAADEALSNWGVALFKREDLYKAIKGFVDTKPDLKGDQKRLLDHTMRDFRRAGMALTPEKRKRVQDIEFELNKDSIQFETNIAEDETTVPFTKKELEGVNPNVVEGMPHTGDVYWARLSEPMYDAIISHAENEDTRQKLFIAWKRRGGTQNIKLLEKVLKLRAEEASLLGYANYADYVLEPRMAKDAATVAKFYADLRPIVRKKAALDFEEFRQAKRDHTHDPKAELYPWDAGFYKNSLSKTKYKVDFAKVQEYLPVDRVVQGLFSVTQSLYGITYNDVTDKAESLGFQKVWFPDVKFYEVVDNATKQVIGHFYTDLFPRPNKYTHAACWGLWERKVWPDGSVQLPLAAIVANLSKPEGDKPALLSHGDTVTFFHEFGHCLHNMLTTVRYGRFSGTSVARDFVEAPSQMFENWVWDPKVLQTFARHYKTGEPFPESLLAGLKAARSLGSGLDTERQFFYGLSDQRYHTTADGVVDTQKVQLQTFAEVEQYKPIPETYFQASFGHLMGYAAAYYGYEWSLVYAADMFQRFDELGLLNPEAGKYYRDKVLSKGGTEEEMDMLKDYLGREPNLNAYLRLLGIDPTKK